MNDFFSAKNRTLRAKLYWVICLSFFIVISGNSAIAEPGGGTSLKERIIFITHNVYRVEYDFIGIEEANRACQREAEEAGLPGTFLAWISGNSILSSPYYRFEYSTDPYVRVDGKKIAENWIDLTDEELNVPINVCSKGHDYEERLYVWTNTTPQAQIIGRLDVHTCNNWTEAKPHDWTGIYAYRATFGMSNATDRFWTDSEQSANCDSDVMDMHFYCVQQGK